MLSVERRDGGVSRGRVAKRGAVSGMSSRSRYRLIKFLAKVNRPDAPVFLTLTYREFTEDYKVWKKHLDGFRQALSYYYPSLAALWRLEFQQRGAPHFHVLLWLGAESDLFNIEALCRRLWLKVIDQDTAANRLHGVTVELVNDFRKTAFYISLYQAKDGQDRTDILTGREWGCWNRSALNIAPVETVDLSDAGCRLFRRLLRRAYCAHCRSVGRAVGPYSRALSREQNFSSFLSYSEGRRILKWVAGLVFENEPF